MTSHVRADDLVAIQLLIQRFAALTDIAEDIGPYLDMVTEDAVFSYEPVAAIGWAGATYRGRDEIRAGVEQRRADGIQGPGTRTVHIVSDITIDLDDDDSARVYAVWQFWGVNDAGPACLSIGQYENVVRREDGVWRLARRASRVL
ncbi:nuclear transport factor 2 family protein [uncultured Microbacterium sp.]|uniref:nuclear transport factor 2 family protein n=1 Tax=uncultured Microbacterium sp. TaxID=191216 RepID=UPI0035CC814B